MDTTREEARASNPNWSEFCTITRATITDLWPLGNDTIIYEGCNCLLEDGMVCQLGKEAHQLFIYFYFYLKKGQGRGHA